MKNESERKESLKIVIEQINTLLDKHKIVETLVEKQDAPKQKIIKNLVNKQNINKLERLLANLHPADIADILESLPIEARLIVWDLVKVESDGDILVEVSDAVAADTVNVEDVFEPTALKPVIAPVEELIDAPAGKEPADTEYVIVSPSGSVAPASKVPLLPLS